MLYRINGLVKLDETSFILSEELGWFPGESNTVLATGKLELFGDDFYLEIQDHGLEWQKPLNEGILTGKVYNDTGNPVTLNTVDVSIAGESGPWTSCNILLSDPAFSFPAVGVAGGTAFTIPIDISVVVEGNVNFQIEMSY